MTEWLRHRFHADYDDSRPVKFPPPGPYWETGFTAADKSEGGYAIVIAYLPEGSAVTEWWPEASDIETEEVPEGPTFSDRFPRPKWWQAEGQ